MATAKKSAKVPSMKSKSPAMGELAKKANAAPMQKKSYSKKK